MKKPVLQLTWKGKVNSLNILRTTPPPLKDDIQVWVDSITKSVIIKEDNVSYNVLIGETIVKYDDGSLSVEEEE